MVPVIVTAGMWMAFSAVTTASENVVQCAVSAGVPPLKWYLFEKWRRTPRYVNDFVTLSDGVAAMVESYYTPRTRIGAPEVPAIAEHCGG